MEKVITRNECISLMYKNTSYALSKLSEHIKKHSLSSNQIVDLITEMSEELAAQALVVSMRDELKFDKPIQ